MCKHSVIIDILQTASFYIPSLNPDFAIEKLIYFGIFQSMLKLVLRVPMNCCLGLCYYLPKVS